mmetsp:Transcript_20307/g.30014  ORF Transcript_20307/g.30014 Transcript_20307/m.30014 type:complete len:302 (-) Transcript_20307:18-923(-)
MLNLLLFFASIGLTNGFLRTTTPFISSQKVLQQKFSIRSKILMGGAEYTLVLVRHGESTWNDENRFTGWADVPLSARGKEEAISCGKILAEEGYTFDQAYTSLLKRAINTLWAVLEETDQMWIPVDRSWRLNERHYGALQGLNKQETVDKHGKEKVLIWRRSYDIPPPELTEESEHYPGNDPRYVSVDKALLPKTESLKITEERFMVEWEGKIVPTIKSGKQVLIVAHGNTLRALVKNLDGISEQEITGLNIPTGIPLVYKLDKNIKPIRQKDAIFPLSGMYLGDQDAIKERILGVANQTK